MSPLRIVFYLCGFAVAGLLLGYGGYTLYETYQAFSAKIALDRVRTAQIEENRVRTSAALGDAGISPLQAGRGFWYIYSDAYGSQSVAYFNPDTWAMQDNLTDEEIAGLAHTVASSSIRDADAMRVVPENELPPRLQFHNSLYSGRPAGEFQMTQKELEALYTTGKATADQLWELSYMYELQGDYAARDAVNAVSCKTFKQRCEGSIPVLMRGVVHDLSGAPVVGARVSVLSHPEVAPATTDARGAYTLSLSVLPLEKLRLSAVKRNYSDGVANLVVLGAGVKVFSVEPIVLGSPITIVTVDTERHTVSDPKDSVEPDGAFVLHATSSTYRIPANAIVGADGKPYRGAVDVYLYEFTRDTVPQSLVTLDTFDQVMGYAGDLMYSYGMPYIQFFTSEGRELDVTSSNPMLLTYRIPAMQTLRDNADNNPAGKLTDAQMQLLVAASQGDPGFPITREFLVKHQLYTFPPFWVFDRRAGVWDNVGIRVLNTDGMVQAPFYTVK